MPKASEQSASRVEDMAVMEGRYEDLGGYTVGFETFHEDADVTVQFPGSGECGERVAAIVRRDQIAEVAKERAAL
jgi:hypothetical protein